MPSVRKSGPRAAGVGNRGPSATAAVVFTGGAQLSAALPDGEYDLVIEGGRAVTSKSGATSVVITSTADGQQVRVRPLLVASPGGSSQLVDDNRAIVAALAGLEDGEQVDLPTLLKRLAGRTVGVELALTVDQRGQAVNEIVGVFGDDDDEAA